MIITCSYYIIIYIDVSAILHEVVVQQTGRRTVRLADSQTADSQAGRQSVRLRGEEEAPID